MSRVALSAPEPVWPLAAPLLEGPAWVARDAALWFTDIKGRRIHRYDPADGTRRSWDAPAQVGFCLPAAGGGFVAGLQTGLARFDPATGRFDNLVDPEPDRPANRLNDGVVDPHGRLWFGTMDDGEAEPVGRIYRLDRDGRCVAVTAPVAITNGPAVSPDGGTLYHVDTLGGTIHAALIARDGTLRDEQRIIAIPADEGYPDGPAVDAEGCLWVALYGGRAARRYAPSGECLEEVRFPVSAVTKLAFGRDDGCTVYATTASKHLDAAGRAAEPLAGALMAFRVAVPGLPSPEITIGL